ncbi:hypothetical protein QE320_gp010 [Pseudomonas phage EM]|uniref:Uncharacterized protein n=1 Tax=Pseudomonas phage EM TaxID=2936914 RepID=A0AAE9HHC8_9CAUD|nr:hypothetical protein QE320_gp010 [Pseudomonas phage EM]UPW35812.1 hypothetical protein EM_010 [Pseudomonas phage EM]
MGHKPPLPVFFPATRRTIHRLCISVRATAPSEEIPHLVRSQVFKSVPSG